MTYDPTIVLTVQVRTENAAFGESEAERAAECARILRGIAEKLDAFDGTDTFQTVHNVNGNSVGVWKLGPKR